MTSEERNAEWNACRSAWQRGTPRSISPESFGEIFRSGAYSLEAVQLLGESDVAREMLQKAAVRVNSWPGDSDVRRVWLAVHDDEALEDLFATHRDRLTPGEKVNLVRSAIRDLIPLRGRKFAREVVRRRWWWLSLLEEEREALVRGLFDGGIRDASFYRSLGTSALEIARQEAWKQGWPEGIGTTADFILPSRGRTSTRSASRFQVLFTDMALATDLRDACLTPDEIGQLGTWPSQIAPPWSALRRALRHMQHFPHPAFEEFAEAMARYAHIPRMASASAADTSFWRFPVLRLLHLQQILEAPRLSKVVRDPAIALVPDVALYLMGRDDVVFQPELRVLRGSDRRWRARWVESAGEAISAMFLEDSVQLDLSTLARVPEHNNQPTPDFMAGTVLGQNVVFESKGATQWETHLRQRLHALEQLGKGKAEDTASWAANGRTFACSLFAAQQGDERTSFLHVDDPPFRFEEYFGEGWESHCRREHAIAMLEAARLYELADDLSRRRRTEVEPGRVETFQLPGGEGQQEGDRFVGAYLPIAQWARSLRHPDPRSCERMRMFVGIEQSLYHHFERGEFPARLAPSDATATTDSQGEPIRGPVVGLLPGPERESGEPARGMYSVLADGAFMAVEFE